MVGTVLRTYKATIDRDGANSLVIHSVLLCDTANRSTAMEPYTVILLLLNLALQMVIRLSKIGQGSLITDILVSSQLIYVIIALFILLPASLTVNSLAVPSVKKSEKCCVETNSRNLGAEVTLFGHLGNFFVCTPIACGLLLSLCLTQLCGYNHGLTSSNLYYEYGVILLFGVPLYACFFTMHLGVIRQRDCLMSTSRAPLLFQTLTLCLAVGLERVRDHSLTSDVARILLILFNFAQSLWAFGIIIISARSISFHSSKYRLVTLLGMIAVCFTSTADLFSLFILVDISQKVLWLSLLSVAGLTIIWLNGGERRSDELALHQSFSTVIPQHYLFALENILWEQESIQEPSFKDKLFDLISAGLKVLMSSSDLTQNLESNLTLSASSGSQQSSKIGSFAEHIFRLYRNRHIQTRQQVVDVDFSFSFAHFLLKWKKHIFLLTTLHRTLTSASLSIRHSVSLAVLEAAITRQLQTQDAEFSYFYSESSQPSDSTDKPKSGSAVRRVAQSLDVYSIIDTVSAFEHLVDQMRVQLRLQTQFLTAVESRSQPVAEVHTAVRVITEQRTHCKDLFADLHAKADAAQTFHLLPFAFFLEHTENNLERRVELVKTYYFKSQVRRVHSRLFNELVDQSLTVVTESERGKLGAITHSSKNVGLVFGADIPPLEGRSLDVFFHAEMATAHRRQMREYMQHFDRPYLGDRRERYVTVGNGVYYRVECVTKFVPHLKQGFQFVTMMKHLTDETGKYGKMDDAGIQLIVDDQLKILGIGYNQSLAKRDRDFDEESRFVPSKNKAVSASKMAINAALAILPEIEGKSLSTLSYELSQKLGDELDLLHTASLLPEKHDPKTEAGGKHTSRLKEQVSIQSESPSIQVNDPKSHPEIVAHSKGQSDLNHPQSVVRVYDSNLIIIDIDTMKGVFVSDAEEPESGSGSDSENIKRSSAAEASKIRLFVNFTHFCVQQKSQQKLLQVRTNLNQKKSGLLANSEKLKSDWYESYQQKEDHGEEKEIPDQRGSSHVGLTVVRIQNPNKLDLLNLNDRSEKVSLNLQRKNSIYFLGADFDPLKLISRLINLRNCQELIHNYMTRPELAEIENKKSEAEELTGSGQMLKPGDITPVKTPMGSGNPTGRLMFQNFFHDGQLQLAVPDKYSNRTNSLDNNVVSAHTIDQSQTNTQIPWQTARAKDGKNILGSKAAGKKKVPSKTMIATVETKANKDPHAQQATEKLQPKGILNKGVTVGAKAKTDLRHNPKHQNSDIESAKSHKTISKGVSQKEEHDKFLVDHGTKKSYKDELAASIGGQSIASSRISEININRTIWWMISHPSANNSSKAVVFAVMVLYWTFCHTYQTVMLETFSTSFNGIAHLQNLFGIFINFDSQVKAAVSNILDREMTPEFSGYPKDRYSWFNPRLQDIVEQSKLELPYHVKQAYLYHRYMRGNLSLLQESEIEAFTNSNLVLKNLSVKTSEDQEERINIGVYWLNSIQVSLMVLYDLRVWNEDITNYGSWAARNFYQDSIEGWFELLKKITESFSQSYTSKIENLDKVSVVLSLSGLFLAQIFILIVLRQFSKVRIGIIKNITIVQCLRPDEIELKQSRLQKIDNYLANNFYIGSEGKQSITPMIVSLARYSRNANRESSSNSGRKEKTPKQSVMKQFKKQRIPPPTDNKARLSKIGGSKIKSTFLQWFGTGSFAIALVLVMELQSVINILTASHQRRTSQLYRDWLDINQHYYLLSFYMNNMPTAIYIDNCGDTGLFDLVEDLHPYVYGYSDKLDADTIQLVRHVLEKQTDAETYGYQKFFQNPCDLIDLSIYNLPKESCNSLNSGVIQMGYIRFVDIERLNYIKLNDSFHDEHKYDYHASERREFTTVAFHLKNIHQMMFPLINRDILAAAQNFNQITWEYAFTYGVVIQILLSLTAGILVLVWMFVADAKLSTAVSTYLILPAESLALNHYIRAQIKMLFDNDKLF